MLNDFTLNDYKILMSNFSDRGYEVKKYEDVVPDQKHLIVRHDVDFSPKYASIVAHEEAKLDISAYYYFLVRSPFYNIFEPECHSILRQLLIDGHHIGLHFDAALYENDRAALEKSARAECDLFETILNAPITTISFHRPARELIGEKSSFAGRLHSYDPRFISDIDYCSDSGGQWKYNHPLQTKAVKTGSALQLLTHPIWWYKSSSTIPGERIQSFLDEMHGNSCRTAELNCRSYQAP